MKKTTNLLFIMLALSIFASVAVADHHEEGSSSSEHSEGHDGDHHE